MSLLHLPNDCTGEQVAEASKPKAMRDFEDPMVVIREPAERGTFGIDMTRKNAGADTAISNLVAHLHRESV